MGINNISCPECKGFTSCDISIHPKYNRWFKCKKCKIVFHIVVDKRPKEKKAGE